MRAISIRQPWAWLIVYGGKDVENRDWASRYVGPLLIHASKGCTRAEYEEAFEFVMSDDRLWHHKASTARLSLPALKDLDRGGVIGKVIMTGCVTRSLSPWFFGPYGFTFEHPEPLPFMPYRGQLMFFDIQVSDPRRVLR